MQTPPHPDTMNTTPTPTTLPVTVEIAARWVDYTDETRPQFRFMIVLTCEGRTMRTEYSGGILAFGAATHPATVRELAIEKHAYGKTNGPLRNLLAGRRLIDKDLEKRLLETLSNRATMDPAGVCYSLISDAQAGSESFADFCSDFGYDEDSRKAFTTYEACQKNGKEFRALVGPHFAAIETALENY